MPTSRPTAIVDIGSNSIRLAVYAGAPRMPSIIFNEKVLAGL
jgi:exopolyphosphatase/guanosine-5'-triphosphate,3'-diphosphate pyrophosphatase